MKDEILQESIGDLLFGEDENRLEKVPFYQRTSIVIFGIAVVAELCIFIANKFL